MLEPEIAMIQSHPTIVILYLLSCEEEIRTLLKKKHDLIKTQDDAADRFSTERAIMELHDESQYIGALKAKAIFAMSFPQEIQG